MEKQAYIKSLATVKLISCLKILLLTYSTSLNWKQSFTFVEYIKK